MLPVPEFPALHQSADSLSIKSQTRFFGALALQLSLLIGAAFISALNSTDRALAIAQLVAVLGALGSSIFLAALRPDRLWYAARAVAESAKTIAWRYAVRAEPFHGADDICRSELTNRLAKVVEQNKGVVQKLTSHLARPQITPWMDSVRAASLKERVDHYVQLRVTEQLNWYATKAEANSRSASKAFSALIILNSTGVLLAIAKVNSPADTYWIDVALTGAACVLTWMQAKRYSDLAASYSLAATEIGLLMQQFQAVTDDVVFSARVSDSENAFSREHTQWTARRDL
jgi:hypothetical protein